MVYNSKGRVIICYGKICITFVMAIRTWQHGCSAHLMAYSSSWQHGPGTCHGKTDLTFVMTYVERGSTLNNTCQYKVGSI